VCIGNGHIVQGGPDAFVAFAVARQQIGENGFKVGEGFAIGAGLVMLLGGNE